MKKLALLTPFSVRMVEAFYIVIINRTAPAKTSVLTVQWSSHLMSSVQRKPLDQSPLETSFHPTQNVFQLVLKFVYRHKRVCSILM